MPPTEKEAPASAGAEGAAPTDEIKNLKAEMGRKLGNYEQTITALKQSQDALMAQLTQFTAPKSTGKAEEKLEDLFYSNPAEYTRRVKEETAKSIRAELNEERTTVTKQQATYQAIVRDFPEISDGESDLSKLALEKLNSMDDKATPAAMRAAVAEAAVELGMKPKSKRTQDDSDSFSLGGGGRASSSRASAERKGIDTRTKTVAELLGVDPEKVKNRMNKRKSYTSWE